MLTLVDTVKQWETPTPGSGIQGYTDTAFPWGNNQVPLVINYYDNYTFQGQPSTVSSPTGASIKKRGLLTATKTAVLNTSYNPTPDMLWSVYYYDDLGRTIQTYNQHYLGGLVNVNNYDVVTNTFDFTNEVIATTRKHYAGSTTPNATVANTYVYDHMGRKKQTFEQINTGSNILLVQNDYNEIGQVMTKHLHSTNNGGSFLQNTSYAYNERGWLSKINDPSIAPTTTKLFAEQLNYNTTYYGGTPKYNGNIAEQDYNAGVSTRQHVVYGYDNLNRLISGNSTAGFSETGISYDLMGNLLTLTRAGTGNGTLNYTAYNGNSLTTISGFTAGSYMYDYNGNQTTDGPRGATIAYNMLNLPQTVTASSVNITYTYSANGTKLRKMSNNSPTDYINGIHYKPDAITIDFIQTEEGRAINSGTSYNYEYTLTDHLGNNRVTFDMVTGKVGEDDYYPFGLNIHRLVNSTNNYLYNKKELQVELTEYDYGARFYDPVIARWNTIDPLAEDYEEWSPFNYVQNNPIRMTDPNGMGHFDTNGNWVADPSDATTYDYLSQVTQRGQTFTWMGGDVGWIAETQLSDSQLESMYWNYSNAGQNPFQGAYGNQIRNWASSWAGFQSGYRRSEGQLKLAKGVAIGATMAMGGGLAAGEVSGNFLINGVVRGAESSEGAVETTNVVIEFGNDANKAWHAIRHLEDAGLSPEEIEAVKSAVKNDVSKIADQIQTGAKVTSRTINVNGVEVTYNAFKLPNGTINIGRMTVPK